jgi:hypothetical protein
MEFSQLVLVLALALGGRPSGGHTPVTADARPAVRADPRSEGGNRNVSARPATPPASDQERLATRLLFGVAASGRAR